MQAFQDIFISYGRKDSLDFAARLNRRLVGHEFTVWFDYDDIPRGVDYQKQIDDGIERSDNFLFIISPHSINSSYCALELELALKHQKRIIPLLHVERIRYDTWQERNPGGTLEQWMDYQAKGSHDHFQNMHSALRKIDWIKMREGQDDFDTAFAELLALVDRHKKHVHQHTLLLAKALEWERHQKRSPYLLIGEERLQAEKWLKEPFKESQPPCLPTDLHYEFISESRKNANNLMTDVFLAYAEEDQGTAEQIRNSLWREGFTVWLNTSDIHAGADFQARSDRGIEEANNVVYLLSPSAVRSSWCQHELEYAKSLHKRVIPILVEAVVPEQMPLQLQNLQDIDLTDNVQSTDYQQDESQLLRILRQDAVYHENHKLLLTKALKWERQQRNPTLLLRGYNLRHAEDWLKVAKQNLSFPVLPVQESFITESLRQPPGLSLDVFVSYSRADSGFARKLNDALQVHGKRTWFDQESIAAGTADFQQEIYRGIESADTFLFILSPRLVTSPYCADEVEYAAKLNKRFVTLLHQSIDTTALHLELAKVQWLDFNQHEGDFSANFTELLRILDTDVDHLQAHTRLLLRAIEWDTKGRKESLLLRGDELEQAGQWLNQSLGKEPKPTELQQSYVATSLTVEKSQQQATQILQVAAKKGEQAEQKLLKAEKSLQEATAKGKRRLLFGTVAGAIGLIMAGAAGFFVVRALTAVEAAEVRLQTAASGEQSSSGNQFQALRLALESGQALDESRLGRSERNDLQLRIMSVLLQAMNRISEKNTLIGHRTRVSSVSFRPDGKMIASSSDTDIHLWNAETGEEIRTLEGDHAGLASLSFSPDGKTIASGGGNTIQLWNVETGEEIRTLEGEQTQVTSLSFSPDGKTIALGDADNTIQLWNVETGEDITLEGDQAGPSSVTGVSSLSFSPDGKTIASGSFDATIKLWNVKREEVIRTLGGDQAVIVSPSVSTHDHEEDQNRVTSLSFSPNGKTIASGSFDATIKLWNVETGEFIRSLTSIERRAGVLGVSFNADGKTIASGGADNTIKLWNVETGEFIRTLRGDQAGVSSSSFSPDGKTLASGSFDGSIKLWNIETSEVVRTLERHRVAASSVSFSPDGKTIVSAGIDLKLWNVETGEVILTLEGDQAGFSSVSFSPDGKTIVSGDVDNTIKLWVWDYDRLMTLGCEWIQPYLVTHPGDRSPCNGYLPPKQ